MKTRPLLVAAIAAVLAVAAFLVYARTYEQETSGGEGVAILAAVRRIERGTVISDSLLTIKVIPQAYVDDRQIRASERDKILGLKSAEPVGVSRALLWSDVVATRDEKRDLSSLVQSGYRAVTAPFAAMPTYAMIRPGDFVDVIAARADTGESSGGPDSSLLLQRVMVLAIGTSTDNAGNEGRGSSSHAQPALTLSLNLGDAELLAAAAAARAKLTVALRNPNDQRVRDDVDGLDAVRLLGAAPEPASATARRSPDSSGSMPLELHRARR